MDLHVIAPPASPAERAAVDAVIGDASARRRPGTAARARRRSRATSPAAGTTRATHRDLLLPALHAVQERVGWISQPALGYVCRRLAVPPAEAYGRGHVLRAARHHAAPAGRGPRLRRHRLPPGRRRGAVRELERALGPAGATTRRRQGDWLRSPCLGLCERAPAALLTIAGERAPRARRGAARSGGPGGAARGGRDRTAGRPRCRRPAVGTRPAGDDPGVRAAGRHPRPALLARVGVVDPRDLDAYRATAATAPWPGRSSSARRGVIAEMTASRLVGRGGAAFPTGRKWEAVAGRAGPAPLPGLQRRRVGAGHLQGPRAAGGGSLRRRRGDDDRRRSPPAPSAATSTCAASTRWPRRASPHAIGRRARAGLLGADIMGTRLRLRHRDPPRRRRLHLRRGDGALQLDRGQARRAAQQAAVPGRGRACSASPPWSTTSRRWSTCCRSCCDGGAAFAAIGTEGSTGPKLFCVSGHVARPGPLRGAVRDDAARS